MTGVSNSYSFKLKSPMLTFTIVGDHPGRVVEAIEFGQELHAKSWLPSVPAATGGSPKRTARRVHGFRHGRKRVALVTLTDRAAVATLGTPAAAPKASARICLMWKDIQ